MVEEEREPFSHSAARVVTGLTVVVVFALLGWVAVTTLSVVTSSVEDTANNSRSDAEPSAPEVHESVPEPTVVEAASELETTTSLPTKSVREDPAADAVDLEPPVIDFGALPTPVIQDSIGDASTSRVREITVVLGPGEDGVLVAVDNGQLPVDTAGSGVAVRTETLLEMLSNRGFVVVERPSTCEAGCDVTFWVTAGGGFQQGHPDAVLLVYASEATASTSTELDALPALTHPPDTCQMILAPQRGVAALPDGQSPVVNEAIGEANVPRHRSITATVSDGTGPITVTVWNNGKPVRADSSGIAVRTRQTARLFSDRSPIVFERPDTCEAGSTYEFWVTVAPQFAATYPAAELRLYADPGTAFVIDQIERLPAYSYR